MKKIDFAKVKEKNDMFIDDFIGGLEMEFIKKGNNYIIKDSNGRIVSEEEKLKLEKRELVLKDIKSNDCQKETTKQILKIENDIKKVTKKKSAKRKTPKVVETIKEANSSL